MTKIILAPKEKYINELSKKLSNPETAPKTYWRILNRFLSDKKIPSIPPLLVNGEMISNFSKKAELFDNKHKNFATSYHQSLKINEDDILSIIKSLNSNKPHGWGKLSIKW